MNVSDEQILQVSEELNEWMGREKEHVWKNISLLGNNDIGAADH